MSDKDIMTDRNLQPNENNRSQKIKYLSCDTLTRNLQLKGIELKSKETKTKSVSYRSGEFSKGRKDIADIDDEFDDNLNKQFQVKGDIPFSQNCSEKSKYIPYDREMIGSKNRGTFNNGIGQSTRKDGVKTSNEPIDRFHFTYRNYQNGHWASFPEPISTRSSNKNVIEY